MTRIIGYLKRVSNFSKARQEEADRRFYYKEHVVEHVEK
jgi:ribonucleoside-triphosphate reductase